MAAVNHYTGWADACRGEGKTTSNFDYASPLTETVLLGTIAIRVPGETLKWDAAAMKVTNSPAANALLTKPTAGAGTVLGVMLRWVSPLAA
ncbi:MAG: hypothetical protein U0792_20155 [Gemmataceae bacterium]